VIRDHDRVIVIAIEPPDPEARGLRCGAADADAAELIVRWRGVLVLCCACLLLLELVSVLSAHTLTSDSSSYSHHHRAEPG